MAAKRKAISKTLRFEIFKRDGFVCAYCGAHPPSAILHVDHIVPVKEGGTNDDSNLVTACQSCNSGKGARDLNVVPQSLEDRARLIKERERQLLGYQEIIESQRQRIEHEVWRVIEVLSPDSKQYSNLKFMNIKRFVEKLGVHEVVDAAEITRAKHGLWGDAEFRYFCGVCWNKIKKAAQ